MEVVYGPLRSATGSKTVAVGGETAGLNADRLPNAEVQRFPAVRGG